MTKENADENGLGLVVGLRVRLRNSRDISVAE